MALRRCHDGAVRERREFFVGPPDPVVERAQAFVSRYWDDTGSEDEVRADLCRSAAWSADSVRRDLAALQSVLADSSSGWRLTYLVEIDANCGLDEFTEAAARAFLDRFVAMAEDLLRPYRQ
jgi:hypothetical protein